jgi:oligopeptide/dipeptide ABC transporter ATP-binding protein
MPLLEVRQISKNFPIKAGLWGRSRGQIRAVDDVSFTLDQGQTLGIVGESGCGKSTLSRIIMRLIEPSAGRIIFDGRDILPLSAREMRKIRPLMQMIFQDPYASLNPRMQVRELIGEGLIIHKRASGQCLDEQVEKLLEQVGLPAAARHQYPHEFSGGQRQRIGIARALSLRPKLIVADEPVSALDVSIQAQILNLLRDLQAEYRMACLFIAHDLRVVDYMSDTILVMYLGRMMEMGPAGLICTTPRHPYTQALLAAVPQPDPTHRPNRLLTGELSRGLTQPAGCCFHPRCPYREKICEFEIPRFTPLTGNHAIACHLFGPART